MIENVTRPAIPRTIVALGLVSLFMDMSSELIHSLLPVFLVGTLGASAATLGLIEGAAEALALIVKVFSGTLSDAIGKRKPLLLAGYGLAALSKPFFPLAHSAGAVLAARLTDRFGKGIRGAPRDALVADVAPPEIRGACFGLRQGLDTVGAFAGPFLAIALMLALHGDIRGTLWFGAVPTAFAVVLLLLGVDEPPVSAAGAIRRASSPINRRALGLFNASFWNIVSIGAVFTLARFSEAFLILKAQRCGFSPTWIPIVMAAMSAVYCFSAYPVGILSDRFSKIGLLAGGLAILIAADIVLALATGPVEMLAGAGLWGLHMGMTQGVLAAMVAESAPAELKGSAFGVFNLATGITMLLSSVIAGALWTNKGSAATFEAGAGFALLALAMIAVASKRRIPDSA